MPSIVIVAFFNDGQKNEENQWQDGSIAAGSADTRDGLRNPNAEEIEVVQSRSLEDKLFGEKIPDRIARGLDCIRDVCVTTTLIDERFLRICPQRNTSAISRWW